MSDIRVGQIWQDNDPRVQNRYLRVVAVQGDKAECVAWYDRVGSMGRTVRISLARFTPTSTGYRLVKDVGGTDG